MKKTFIALAVLLSITGACSRDDITIDPDNLIIGVWNYSGYQDNTQVFSRNNEFIENHCYRFNADGTLTERKNSGWCGTPPISYGDYPGTWSILNDTLIQIEVGYWGGTTRYKLDIEAVDSESLTASFVYDEN
ncbi:hypothetical protein EG832_01425 [bacterium]|jgi:hypothetical protein|nr:hypothetical protein [bacterium]